MTIKRALLLPVILLVISSCQQKPAETAKDAAPDPKLLVSCEGIGEVKLTDSYEDLVKKFGDSTLSEHSNTITGAYTTIWDNSPQQINVFWKEKSAPFVHIDYIETASSDSPYITKSGLKTGMSLADIAKINTDMPLTFNNPYLFENQGLITSFNNGAIATADPCVGGRVEVTNTSNLDAPTLDGFKQEKIVESSHKLLRERIGMIFSAFRVTAK